MTGRRVWIAGHNLTGYLSESTPFWTLERDDAFAWMDDELEARLDYEIQGDETDEDYERRVADAEEMVTYARDCHAMGDDTFYAATDGAPYVSYWIETRQFDSWGDMLREATGCDESDSPDAWQQCRTSDDPWQTAVEIIGECE